MRQDIHPKTKAKQKKKRQSMLMHMIFLALATLMALIMCIFAFTQYMKERKSNQTLNAQVEELSEELEHSYSEEKMNELLEQAKKEQAELSSAEGKESILQFLQEHFSTGGSTLDALKQLYPDDLIVADKGFHFIPISETLEKHPYQLDQFIPDEDGYLQYHENGEVVSKKGIDVSRFQEKIDWKKVAADDIDYVFIRSAVRGYTKGEIMEDERFEENIKGALKAGLDVGIYFVTQAKNEKEAIEEAEYVLDQIEPYKVTYPIVLDVEDVENAEARSAGLTMDERTDCIIAFCETIKEAGYEPMIYGNMVSFMRRMNLEQLEQYKKWIAYYDTNLYFPYQFDIWQYTSKGSINGIKGNVDYNVSFYEP